jgi:hypothetical protein
MQKTNADEGWLYILQIRFVVEIVVKLYGMQNVGKISNNAIIQYYNPLLSSLFVLSSFLSMMIVSCYSYRELFFINLYKHTSYCMPFFATKSKSDQSCNARPLSFFILPPYTRYTVLISNTFKRKICRIGKHV